MTRQWIRLYTKVPHDPKIQRLEDALFRFWVNAICLAGAADGALPAAGELAWALRMTEREALEKLAALEARRLVDQAEGVWRIHDWSEHQYDSDFSRLRTERWRARRHGDGVGDVTVTSPNSGGASGSTAAAAPARGPDWLPGVIREAAEGIELPQEYVTNEYGRRDLNPQYRALQAALENARERIRRSRRPVAYCRTLILVELGRG
jgi:hypothetical protein